MIGRSVFSNPFLISNLFCHTGWCLIIFGSTVVVFVDSIDKADQLVKAGVIINGALMPVFPLTNPVKKVVMSNVPPFL